MSTAATAGLDRFDRELLPFALELASFGAFLADELFLGMDDPRTDAEHLAWLVSATRRHLIVAVPGDPAVSVEYTVDRLRCERRVRGLERAR